MNWKNFLKPDLKKVVTFIVLIILSVVIPVLVLGTPKFYFVIAGQAMSPEYNAHDRVLIKKVGFSDLKIGDVILFSPLTTKVKIIVIGRISSIDYGKKTLKTFAASGNNIFYGESLPSEIVTGKVMGKSPYLFDLLYGNFLIKVAVLYLLSCFIGFGIKKKSA